MAGSMADLIILLAENEKALEDFSLALEEEQQCIIDLDLERLAATGSRKERIMSRLTALRDECRTVLQQAGSERGIKGVTNLSLLIDAAAGSEQMKLRPLQRRLERVATALERQHEMNRRLLGKSADMVNGSLALFGRLLGGGDTYGAQGRITNGRTGWSLLRQEI